MFQFIILGLLFLFIVLHFYTDIKNYINTGNIIEGNDEDAAVPDAGADTGAYSSADAGSAAGADAAAPATPVTTPEPTDSNLNRGVCMGKLKSDDSACLILDNETDCNADNKCNWASGINLDDGTTWSAGGAGQGQQEKYEQDFRRAPSAPGIASRWTTKLTVVLHDSLLEIVLIHQ